MSDLTHVMYIDDSGTKEYAPRYGRRGASRHFLFGGPLLTIEEAARLTSEIIKLKLNYFNVEDVEIKSNWLRHAKERQRYYLNPYDISEPNLKAFVEDYYGVVCASEVIFIASVVDKVAMENRYPSPWYPPAVAYETLLQRVDNEMSDRGIVTISMDDMTGATPKGNQYKKNLDIQHERMKKTGSKLLKNVKFECIKGRLRFVNSAQSHLIQLADIAAYNVYRQFTDYGGSWEHPLFPCGTYDYFERLLPRFRASPAGLVRGYGVVMFPSEEK